MRDEHAGQRRPPGSGEAEQLTTVVLPLAAAHKPGTVVRPKGRQPRRLPPLGGRVGTLAELRGDGLIRHIGLTNVTPDQLSAETQIVQRGPLTAHVNSMASQPRAHLASCVLSD